MEFLQIDQTNLTFLFDDQNPIPQYNANFFISKDEPNALSITSILLNPFALLKQAQIATKEARNQFDTIKFQGTFESPVIFDTQHVQFFKQFNKANRIILQGPISSINTNALHVLKNKTIVIDTNGEMSPSILEKRFRLFSATGLKIIVKNNCLCDEKIELLKKNMRLSHLQKLYKLFFVQDNTPQVWASLFIFCTPILCKLANKGYKDSPLYWKAIPILLQATSAAWAGSALLSLLYVIPRKCLLPIFGDPKEIVITKEESQTK